MNLANWLTIIGFVIFVIVLIVIAVVFLMLYVSDRTQQEHPVLRNYPVLGRIRYIFEKIGPEMRQYWFNSDTEGRPFSRNDMEHIVRSAKYKRDVHGFGSERDFEADGFYVANQMFPKQMDELKMDRETQVHTKRYILIKDPMFTQREEKWEEEDGPAYLLHDDDAVVVGPNTPNPFITKGLIGMSAMSYGSLGENALTALSEGLAIAKGAWMNTGEGGLSPYHLKGNVNIIAQIGPGLFGYRDKEGNFSWEELGKKAEMDQIKAFELKLAQGAKTRGGHVDADKVTPEVAKIRLVEPFKSIDSPNRFHQFQDVPSMVDFIEEIRAFTKKPVGIKLVVGRNDSVEELAAYMKNTGKGPDFITVDGGEGGTGASYQELMDSVGLPIKSALPIVDSTLKRYGVRDRVKLIASGKLFTPDRMAVALAMGADLINVARAFMITVGCIQTLQCHANICPVGVATTNKKLQKALVVDEKKYRTANYLVTMRKGLFRIAAAAGIDSPVHFRPEHIIFKDDRGVVHSLEEIYQSITQHEQNDAQRHGLNV